MKTIFQNNAGEILFVIEKELSTAPGEEIQLQNSIYFVNGRKTFIDIDNNIAYVFTVTKQK
jgi:hypothetical protein